VEDGTIKIDWISTTNQAADGLTKALGVQKHTTFLRQLKMRDITEMVEQLDQK
jgi:hypothetical protein